ncbi:MAG: DUF4922 domain-containing protein, partial [Sedimenticola sp.]
MHVVERPAHKASPEEREKDSATQPTGGSIKTIISRVISPYMDSSRSKGTSPSESVSAKHNSLCRPHNHGTSTEAEYGIQRAVMNPSTPLIQPGTLWQRILETSRNSIASGALQPIETEQTIIEENGIRFQARWVSSLRRKAETRTSTGRSPANPFLPPEPELTLGAVSDTHIGILNKFNVIDNHLLIVTREFQPQEALLDLQDFSALCRCLPEFASLGFYNGGAEAGASQGHKHLQLIPLPLMEDEPDLPIQPLLDRRDTAEQITSLPGVSFSNALVRFSSPLRESDDRYCLEWYLKLLDYLDMPGREENGR